MIIFWNHISSNTLKNFTLWSMFSKNSYDFIIKIKLKKKKIGSTNLMKEYPILS